MPDRRQVNENRSKLFGTNGRPIAFICECSNPQCTQTIVLTASQADDVRELSGWIVAPGHDPILDDVIVPFPVDDR